MQNIGAMVDSYWDRRMARAERDAADREQAVEELQIEPATAVLWIEQDSGQEIGECFEHESVLSEFAAALCAISDDSAHRMLDNIRTRYALWLDSNEDLIEARIEATRREYAEAAADARGDV